MHLALLQRFYDLRRKSFNFNHIKNMPKFRRFAIYLIRGKVFKPSQTEFNQIVFRKLHSKCITQFTAMHREDMIK